MSFNSDQPALPQLPGATAPPPAFGQQQGQKKPKAKSMQPSFLGTEAMAQPGQLGQKTLLGQ